MPRLDRAISRPALALAALGCLLALVVGLAASRRAQTAVEGSLSGALEVTAGNDRAGGGIAPCPAFTFTELAVAHELLEPLQNPATGRRYRVAELAVEWSVNGRLAHSGETLKPEFTHRGDEVHVAVRGKEDSSGEPLAEAATRIVNSPPRILSVVVRRSRQDPTVAEARVQATDPDGDPLKLRYEWSVDGQIDPDLKGSAFPLHTLTRGQELVVAVTGSDGQSSSIAIASDPLSYANHPPRFGTTITARRNREMDGSWRLVCPVEVMDPDGDEVRVELVGDADGVRWDDEAQALVWLSPTDGKSRSVTLRATDDSNESTERDFMLRL